MKVQHLAEAVLGAAEYAGTSAHFWPTRLGYGTFWRSPVDFFALAHALFELARIPRLLHLPSEVPECEASQSLLCCGPPGPQPLLLFVDVLREAPSGMSHAVVRHEAVFGRPRVLGVDSHARR